MPEPRKVIVHIATSADGFIARSDGDLEWLTSRPKPKDFTRRQRRPAALPRAATATRDLVRETPIAVG